VFGMNCYLTLNFIIIIGILFGLSIFLPHSASFWGTWTKWRWRRIFTQDSSPDFIGIRM